MHLPRYWFTGEVEKRAAALVLLLLCMLPGYSGLHEEAALLWEGRGVGSAVKNLLIVAQHPVISCPSHPLLPIGNLMQDYEVCGCRWGYWGAESQQKVLWSSRHTDVK